MNKQGAWPGRNIQGSWLGLKWLREVAASRLHGGANQRPAAANSDGYPGAQPAKSPGALGAPGAPCGRLVVYWGWDLNYKPGLRGADSSFQKQPCNMCLLRS